MPRRRRRPATTDPNLDPATGFDYGTPQDLEALNANAGSPDLGFGSGIGLGGGGGTGEFFDPATGQFDLTSPFTGSTAPPAVTTNAQWEQEAIADLEAGGVAQSTINDATSGLPRYLAHLTLSSAQASAVQQAVGLAGPPPSGGPFAIRMAPPPAKPPSAHVKVPNVVGKEYAAAAAEIHAAGLKPHQQGPGKIVQQRPAAGTEASRGSTVTLFGANK